VGGEWIDLTVLAGPGVDTHTYSPSPSDAAALAEAQLVLENGLEFEGWLDDLYEAAGSGAVRVQASDGIEPLTSDDHADESDHDEAEDDRENEAGHAHGEFDPHIWHSVANAVMMVRNIRDGLIAADPEHASDYRANADAYTAQLLDLDAWIFETVARLPVERRVLVTTHDTFGYLAERYGFTIVGTVLPTSTEGASPSAQELAALVEAIRAARVPVVFGENVAGNGLLSQVAAEAGVEVVASLFTDALGPEGSAATTYLSMMRFNVSTIVDALAS
jgi:ABC-type Zn uptake system ZnuABC Zn-binding protein ZnuA